MVKNIGSLLKRLNPSSGNTLLGKTCNKYPIKQVHWTGYTDDGR